MKIVNKIFLIILAVLLIIPVAAIDHTPGAVSDIDNRALASWELSRSGITSYIEDRIGFRSDAINAYTVLNDRVFGEMVHPMYTYGTDGYVFFKMQENSIDTEHIDALCRCLRVIQDYCEARGVPFIYCATPAKITIYPEYLPEGYIYSHSALTQLYETLEAYGINYISTEETLKQNAQTEQVFNVKYDAGHYNDLGQFYATNLLLEKVAEYFPAVRQHELSDFDITTQLQTSLMVSRFPISEEVPLFTCRLDDTVEQLTEQFAGLEMSEAARYYEIFRNTAAEGLPRTLFFYGSHYIRTQEFHACSFAQTYAIHNYHNLLNFEYYFNIFQPECVILELAENAIEPWNFDFDAMANKSLNPALSEVVGQPHTEARLDSFEVEREEHERLVKVSFSSDREYGYGYLVAGEAVFDLAIEGQSVSCTVDGSLYDLTDAVVHLF